MVDQVMPSGAWAFDASVTAVFDNMLARSIPQYEVMRTAVTDLAVLNLPDDGGVLVDLGCSRGQALAAVAAKRPFCRYVGVEISQPMAAAARENAPYAEIMEIDLRNDYPDLAADVTLSVLALQFIPIEHRQRILRNVCHHTRRAFVLVEKVLGSSAQLDEDFIKLYYALKGSNGYSPEQIERKRLSLEGVLVPVTAEFNQRLLHAAGFSQVDCFWRWMNFAGWIAIK